MSDGSLIALILVTWAATGIAGAVLWMLSEQDLTVGDLLFAVGFGLMGGPFVWVVRLLTTPCRASERVLIRRRGRRGDHV